MKEVTLDAIAKEKGTSELAAALGCTASAITQALHDCRDIRVRMRRGGIHDAYEIRPFPSQQRHKETA